MPKKGTPQYEIWKQKFQEKRAQADPQKKQKDRSLKTVSSLKKKISENLIAEEDLLILMFLADIEPATLSVSSLSSIQKKLSLEKEEFSYIVSFFRTLSKDQLKLRLVGVYNYYNINKAPDTYPSDFKEKYSSDSFEHRYGYTLESLFSLKQ